VSAAQLDEALRPRGGGATVCDDAPPFVGGRLVMLGYELGAALEPAARLGGRAAMARRWPDAVVIDCPDALVHDGATGRWLAVGDIDAPAISAAAEQADSYEIDRAELLPGDDDRRGFEERVARVVEYIRAGDIFQANLSHVLSAGFEGSARGLMLDLLTAARPWYGAYLEWPGHAVVSASPELFLEVDAATRRVVTRPIKGTRPGDADPRSLIESEKDAAELNMIVDLMRNDLGRVCEFGSVRVAEGRMVERHAHSDSGARGRTGMPGVAGWGGRGVLHGVATIEGRMRAGTGLGDLLRATFPGGSITGAPKIRAMQIIEELEQRERGPYTGAIGFVSDCGRSCFNIAIRTAAIRGDDGGAGRGAFSRARLEYGVGAGIVADSSPASEWEETLNKAEVILKLAARPRAVMT
jgi:anthranilate/para-aminobenzoate synthase component I